MEGHLSIFTTDPSIIDLGFNVGDNIAPVLVGCRQGVSLDHLSRLWRIDIDAAKKTLEITI